MPDTVPIEQSREERIRLKAYELWEEAGRPLGDPLPFWLAAERWEAGEDEVEMASQESFPASDPPAWSGVVGVK